MSATDNGTFRIMATVGGTATTMSPSSKKRKRDVESVASGSFQHSHLPASQLGPVLALFPAFEPPEATLFRCYVRSASGVERDGSEEVQEEFAKQNTLVVGETDSMEFFTAQELKSSSLGCNYFVAIHNRRTQRTTFRPAPLHFLTQQVKVLKGEDAAPVNIQERVLARAALGESFGTKKAQAAIKAAQRNKVDVAAMKGVMGHLMDRIEQNTEKLPTEDQLKSGTDHNRLIPPFNAEAMNPSQVYNLYDVIPEVEWKTLSIAPFMNAPSSKDRVDMLLYQRSTWVNQHLASVFKQDLPSRRYIKLLFYISVMFAFRQAARKLSSGQNLSDLLPGVPGVVVDGLLTRFTEIPRGSKCPHTTSETEVKLLTHMFALCLIVDNYSSNTTLLASDLSMSLIKVNQHFKSLGCKIEKLQDKDLERLQLPPSARETKRAVLKVPLQFPTVRQAKQGYK